MDAMSKLGLEVAWMSEEQFRREKLYQATMSLMRMMRRNHLISEEEYRQMDTIFAQKYEPLFGGLWLDNVPV